MTLRRLMNLDDLDAALVGASPHPILIFKHSPTCGISAQAHDEILTLLADPAWLTHVYVVSVQASRGVSNEIAKRLNVRHASPQILLVHEGAVRWQASHFRITADAIRIALQRNPVLTSAPEAATRSLWRLLGAWMGD